jgi:hypothetical protein
MGTFSGYLGVVGTTGVVVVVVGIVVVDVVVVVVVVAIAVVVLGVVVLGVEDVVVSIWSVVRPVEMLLVFGEVGEDVDVSLGQKGNRMYDPGGSSQVNAPFNKLGLERNNCCSQTKSQSHLHRFLSRLIPPWTLSKRPSGSVVN